MDGPSEKTFESEFCPRQHYESLGVVINYLLDARCPLCVIPPLPRSPTVFAVPVSGENAAFLYQDTPIPTPSPVPIQLCRFPVHSHLRRKNR